MEESSLRDSFHEKKDCDQGHEVPEQAPDFLSKKREISTEESRPGEGKGISNYEPEHLPSSEHITIPAIPILQTDWESSPDRDAARCLVDLVAYTSDIFPLDYFSYIICLQYNRSITV